MLTQPDRARLLQQWQKSNYAKLNSTEARRGQKKAQPNGWASVYLDQNL
jgi:hypothetical protein